MKDEHLCSVQFYKIIGRMIFQCVCVYIIATIMGMQYIDANRVKLVLIGLLDCIVLGDTII